MYVRNHMALQIFKLSRTTLQLTLSKTHLECNDAVLEQKLEFLI